MRYFHRKQTSRRKQNFSTERVNHHSHSMWWQIRMSRFHIIFIRLRKCWNAYAPNHKQWQNNIHPDENVSRTLFRFHQVFHLNVISKIYHLIMDRVTLIIRRIEIPLTKLEPNVIPFVWRLYFNRFLKFSIEFFSK